MKKTFILVSLVLMLMFCLTVTAEEVTKNLDTNLTGLRVINGNWLSVDKGVCGDNDGVGNCFIMSDVKMDKGIAFSYTADIAIENIAGGLVFGIEDPDNPEKVWYCMNIDAGNPNSVLVRLFKVSEGALTWTVNIVKSDYEANKSYNFRVDVKEDGAMEFYVDDEYVGEQYDTGYEGGYLGIVTCVSKVTFSNLKYELIVSTPTPEPTFTPAPTQKPTDKVTEKPSTPIPTEEVKQDGKVGENSIWIIVSVIFVLVIGILVVLIIKKRRH